MRSLIIGIVGIVLASCNQQASSNDISAKAAFENYVTELNNGNTSKAAAYYDSNDGFHWIERGSVQYETGQEAANALMSLQSSGGQAHMSLSDTRVAKLSQTSALVSSHFDFDMLDMDGKPQFSFNGWMTVGMVKRPDGWKIAGGQTGPGKTE